MSWIKDAEKAYELSLQEAAERERGRLLSLAGPERNSLEYFDENVKEVHGLLDELSLELNHAGYVTSLEIEWRTNPLTQVPNGLALHSTTHTKRVSGEDKPTYKCLSFVAGRARVEVTVCFDGCGHHLVLEMTDGKGYVLPVDLDRLDGVTLQDILDMVRRMIARQITRGYYTAGSLM